MGGVHEEILKIKEEQEALKAAELKLQREQEALRQREQEALRQREARIIGVIDVTPNKKPVIVARFCGITLILLCVLGLFIDKPFVIGNVWGGANFILLAVAIITFCFVFAFNESAGILTFAVVLGALYGIIPGIYYANSISHDSFNLIMNYIIYVISFVIAYGLVSLIIFGLTGLIIISFEKSSS